MSDDHPKWHPPSGTQTVAAPGKKTASDADTELAGAMTMRVDGQDARDMDAAAVIESGEPFKAGSIIGERYVIERHISSGSFGAVYKARDASIEDHAVALKMLHGPSASEASRKKALRELQLIASVSHPSVVQFKDYGWLGNTLWFTMPWYAGETLHHRLVEQQTENPTPFRRAEARPIFERLAHGLAAMHEVGVNHHDIKPENIFLATVSGFDGGLPILLDLGIASKAGEKPVGFTAKYVSPETALSAMGMNVAEIGAAADVFSLALALRNSLEPETSPDSTKEYLDFLETRATKPVEPPKSRDLRYLAPSFKRWLSIKPETRPTAKEFASELKILTAPEDRKRARGQLIRRLVPVILLAAALVSVLAYQLTRTEKLLIKQEERLSETSQELTAKSKEADLLANKTEEQKALIETEAARAALSEKKANKLDRKLEKKTRAQGRLTLALDELQVVHLELLTQHDALNAEIEKLHLEHNALTTAHTQLGTTTAALQAERDNLDATNKNLAAEIATLQSSQASQDAETNKLKQQIADLKLKIEELKKKLASLRPRKKPQQPAATPLAEEETPTPEPPEVAPTPYEGQ